MGSGHILAYAFDVLMQIYTSVGYLERDAAEAILEHNLYGLDIDDRAYQLAYFSVLMKARQYSRRILRKHPVIHICAIEDSQGLQKWSEVAGQDGNPEQLSLDDQYVEMADYLIDTFKDAKEFGSLITVEKRDYQGLLDYIDRMKQQDTGLFMSAWIQEMADRMPGLVKQAEILSETYHITVTNPPYLSGNKLGIKLQNFIKSFYSDNKVDLFSVFMERCLIFTKLNYCQSMITMHNWMFLSSFEKIRFKVLDKTILNMAHLGARAFEEIGGEVVQTTTFVLINSRLKNFKAEYVRLTAPNSQDGKEVMFLNGENRFFTSQENFKNIPGNTIAYWISPTMTKDFGKEYLFNYGRFNKGLDTGNNDIFLRFWFEVNFTKFEYPSSGNYERKKKWQPYNKGGSYRKWYGNNEYVINWANDGNEIKSFQGSNIRNKDMFFKPGITWSSTSSGDFSCRYCFGGYLFDSKGCMAFPKDNNQDTTYYLMGSMNSICNNEFLKAITPTIDYNPGPVSKAPLSYSKPMEQNVINLVKSSIELSHEDWDLNELSWDFSHHLLIPSSLNETYISKCFEIVKAGL